ncbi:MAG: DUF3997 domain-containing protein [Bacteroidales bacterium]|nr:DUF3997 domain-containing protein [Bacteroidales bacterium]
MKTLAFTSILYLCFLFLQLSNPYYQDMGDGFYFSSDIHGKPVNDIVYDWSNLSKPCDAIVFHDSLRNDSIVLIDSCHHVYDVVAMDVTDYDYNDEYIVAEQKPRQLFETYISKKGMDFLEAKKEGLWDEFDIFEYWIVSKKSCEVYGPLSYNQYEEYKTKLNISSDLKLHRERNGLFCFFEGFISVVLLLLSVVMFFCLLVLPIISTILLFRYVRKVIFNKKL